MNKPELSASKLINLGEELAAIPNLSLQVQRLTSLISDNFTCTASIMFSSKPKSLAILKTNQTFPFNVDSDKIKSLVQENGYFSTKISDDHWLIIPLERAENTFGNFVLKRNKSFSTKEIEDIQKICIIASLAIYATLQSELKNWHQKQLSLVFEVTRKISQITDLDILTGQITTLIQKTFDYYYVAVFLIESNTHMLKFRASALSEKSNNLEDQRPEFENDNHPGFKMGEHMIGYVAQIGEELVADDVSKEPRYKKVDSLPDTKSEVVIPLKIESDILGVFDVQSTQLNAFNEDDLQVLRSLADNIAIAIESARLYQGLQNRVDQLAAVSEVNRAITSILDIDKLLQQIVILIGKHFDFPRVLLYTFEPAQQKIVFKAGYGEELSGCSETKTSIDVDDPDSVISNVLQTSHTLRINSLQDHPQYKRSDQNEAPSGSEITIPLLFGNETLGVLDIHSEKNNAFTNSEQQVLETLADNIAVAIRNAKLYRSEIWRRQVAESLRDVAGLLSENTAIDEILKVILEQLHRNLPCDIAGVWLFESEAAADTPIESRKLYLAAYQTSSRFSEQNIEKISFFPDEWVKKSLSQKEPTIRKPDESRGPIAQSFNLEQNYSSIAAPLITGEDILGMLTLDYHTSGRYGQESQKITSAFASYAAVAIKNARLYATSQEQAWISTILLQVAKATQSLTNAGELASTIVRLTPMVVGVKGCALFLREPVSEIFSLYASYGLTASSESMNLDQPVLCENAPIFEELLLTKEMLQIRNPEEDFGHSKVFSQPLITNDLSLFPVTSRDEVLGALLVAHDQDIQNGSIYSEVMDEERNSIIQGIIQQTAVALENIRLLEAKQEEAYVSTVLLQSAQAVVSSADLEDTLESIVHIMPILVGIESSVIYLWNKEEEIFRAAHATMKSISNEEELIGSSFVNGDFPMLDVVYKHNRPVVHPFAEKPLPPEDWDLVLPDEGQIDPTPILKTRYPLLMGFPLSMNEEVFGVLLAQDKNISTNRERRFELLWGMAQQASLAIQNELIKQELIERQHLEREFQLAREIQQTFLPNQTPEMPGWQMDVHWETARQVGGDFYDFFLLPDGRLAFVIADVSDKGLAASLYMTVTRTLLRAAALEYNDPAETLQRVNDLLLINSQDGLFVTTFYGILSLENGTLNYSIAGHNPPILMRYEENVVEEINKGGIALGALPGINLNSEEVKLSHGDCIVLYTDGVTEAFNSQDKMYGDDRLKRILGSSIGENAQKVLQILKSDLEVFRDNAPLSDDTTILVIFRELIDR